MDPCPQLAVHIRPVVGRPHRGSAKASARLRRAMDVVEVQPIQMVGTLVGHRYSASRSTGRPPREYGA